ncbi:hypothetical protein EIK77_005707 [Talaromyces pinophilus]|nr:hypothetical protein EIK77_005707 [Talaromyces pinophilus]
MDQNIQVDAVDTRWPYRAGYPRLLRPSVTCEPIDKEANPIHEAQFEALQSRINTIIDHYNIPRGPHSPEVVYRAQRWGSFMLPRVIVDCIYEKGKSDSKMWAKAVTEIYTAAKQAAEEGKEIGVELCDRRFADTSHICTPPDSGRLKANWEEGLGYRHQILQLFENLPTMFQVMIPVGRCAAGWREYEWTTVVLFEAMNAEDVVWDFLEERVRSILPGSIDIEIRQRAAPLFCGGDLGAIADEVNLAQYARPPRAGCEISQQNDNTKAGTMGGYVITENTDTKERTTFGVTNAHVALASKSQSLYANWPKILLTARFIDYKETSFDAPAGEGISIQSPGAKKVKKSEKKFLKYLAETEERIETQHEIIEAVQESDPNVSQLSKNALSIDEPKLVALKEGLQLVQSNLSIGTVHSAKLGYRDYTITSPTSPTSTTTTLSTTSPVLPTSTIIITTTTTTNTTITRQIEKFLMDLALIKMDCLTDTRAEEIYLQENADNPPIPKNTTCNFWGVDSLVNPQDAEKHIKVVSRLSRSGSYTMGIVSDFRAVTVVGEKGLPGSWEVESWAITCPRRLHSLDDDEPGPWPFASPGDSGSFIIAAAGWEYDGHDNKITMLSMRQEALLGRNNYSSQPFIVGLLFATSHDLDITYFIPFDAVKSEIESMTGEKLVWPQKRSEALQEVEERLLSWLKAK